MVVKVNTNVAAFGRNTVQVARRYGGVLLVAINRPDVLNALSDDGTNQCAFVRIGQARRFSPVPCFFLLLW